MNMKCAALQLVFFFTASIAMGQQGSHAPVHGLTHGAASLCNLGALPLEVQTQLREKFGSWKIQESADLSPNARKRWGAENPLGCPGISIGQFKNANGPSYAVLLVSRDHSVSGYKFLIFSPKVGQTKYEKIIIEESSNSAVAVDLFLHTEKISEFFSEKWRKKLQVQTSVGILFACAGENEYETDLYYWSNGAFQYKWIDY